MSEILVSMFRHNRWANLRLLDICAELPDERLDATAPGLYGPARDTLTHLLAAEGRYVALLTGETPGNLLSERDGFPGLPALRGHAERTGEALIAIAGRSSPDQILRGDYRGERYEMPVSVPLLQVINHGTEHRAHVVTSLSAQGIEVPAIDAWAFHEHAAHG